MDDEDFLAAVEADNANAPEAEPKPKPEPAPEPEPVTEPETQPDPPLAAEVPSEPATPTEPPVEPKQQPEPGTVPIGALLDTRDRLKAAEAELAQFRAQQQPQATPDVYEDPEGFARAQEQRVSQALYQSNLQWSERIATIQHGEEAVGKAKEWGLAKCDTDPLFNARVASSPDPMGFVVSEYRRDQIASQVTPAEFEQFQAWKTAQTQLSQQTGGQPPPTNQALSIPSPSLAGAPSAGSILTEPVQSDEEIFDEVFPKRK